MVLQSGRAPDYEFGVGGSNLFGRATYEQNWALRPELPTAHHKTLQHRAPAMNSDFGVIHLYAIDN